MKRRMQRQKKFALNPQLGPTESLYADKVALPTGKFGGISNERTILRDPDDKVAVFICPPFDPIPLENDLAKIAEDVIDRAILKTSIGSFPIVRLLWSFISCHQFLHCLTL